MSSRRVEGEREGVEGEGVGERESEKERDWGEVGGHV